MNQYTPALRKKKARVGARAGRHNYMRNRETTNTELSVGCQSSFRSSPAGFDRERDKAGCGALLEYFRSLPQSLADSQCPSSFDLIVDGRFGQRPVNRIGELIRGEHDGHRYDFERICCGRGVYRWRLHEPNRLGYPKNKNQIALPLDDAHKAPPPVQGDYMQRVHQAQAVALPLFAEVRS